MDNKLIFESNRKDGDVNFRLSYFYDMPKDHNLKESLGEICVFNPQDKYSLGHYEFLLPDPKYYVDYQDYHKRVNNKTDLVLPIYLDKGKYGDVSLSTEKRGNSKQITLAGFVYASAEKIKKEYGKLDETTIRRAKQVLVDEFKALSECADKGIYIAAIHIKIKENKYKNRYSFVVGDEDLKTLPYKLIKDYNPEDYTITYQHKGFEIGTVPEIEQKPQKPYKSPEPETSAPGM